MRGVNKETSKNPSGMPCASGADLAEIGRAVTQCGLNSQRSFTFLFGIEKFGYLDAEGVSQFYQRIKRGVGVTALD